jgi:formate C-acetyltransferase
LQLYRTRTASGVYITKGAQTRAKVAKFGSMDADDLGLILPPDDFAWEPTPNTPYGTFTGYEGWSRNFESLMAVYPVYVDPMDAFAGRWYLNLYGRPHSVWNQDPASDFSAWIPEQQQYGLVHGIGAPQHFAPDVRIGFQLGWGGLLEKIARGRVEHGEDKAAFYDAEARMVRGIQGWIRRHIAEIERQLTTETRPELVENLREMAEVNAWIVENPPRTMREACQWWAWFNLASRTYNGDGAGGWLDQWLAPFYEADKAAGRIDDETAIYYLACLLLNETQYYQVGGTLADGRDATNPLSFLILEAAHRMGIACNLTVRVHDGMNEALFLRSVRYLFEDRKAWPRYCNDTAVVQGFMRNGYPEALAHERISVGCHWTVIPGREYTMNDCVKINVAKVFDVALQETLAGDPSLDALWANFEAHLGKAVACIARGLDFQLAHQWENMPELMIDLLCHGTLEQGLDASHGGVEFYNLCVDGSGLATVADSFAALDQRVVVEGKLTWAEVARHLDEDFQGPDGERVRLMLKSSARYGQGGSRGDAWAQRVNALFTRLVTDNPTPEGRRMIPGWFSWSNTISMGRAVRATPNGRRAKAPIAHGANPDPGFRTDGAPTAMAAAIAAVQPGFGNAAPMQLEMDPGLSKEQGGIEKVAGLIRGHFDLGGTLFNINVLDKETLLAAHANPEAYPDLVVRVTGFTAFFASLSPQFRQLVVDRFIAE